MRTDLGLEQFTNPASDLARLIAALAVALALASSAASAQEVPIFRTETTLMEVEVRVTDGKGQPVPGLTKADFELTENGVRQEVATFEFVRKLVPETPADEQPATVGVDAPVSEFARDELRRSTFIYIATRGRREDRLNIYEAVQAFINENLQPGVLVSLEGSPFTSKPSELNEQLEELLKGRSSAGGGGLVDTLAVDLARDFDYSPGVEDLLDEINEEFGDSMESIDDRSSFYRRLRMYEYIDLIRALSVYPGRKLVVLFSTGLPVDEDNYDIMNVLEAEATKHRVRFYVSDVSRLAAAPPGGDAEASVDALSMMGDVLNNGFVQQQQSRQDNQDGLWEMAKRTGGKAVLNSNDFGEVFDVVNEDVGDYYLLGYYPRDIEKRGRFRRLRVRVERKGLRLTYQRGYYEEQTFERMSRSERDLQMHQALTFDTPYTDLPLKVDVDYFRDSRGTPTLVYSVGLHTRDIPAQSAKKGQKLKLAVIAQASPSGSEGGRAARPLVDSKRFEMTMQEASHDQLGEDPDSWLHYGSQMRVPPGEYDWKVIVRDEYSGLLGSYKTRLRVPASGREPGASSLLLTGRISDTSGGKTRNRNRKGSEDVLHVAGTRFFASADKTFRRGDPLYLLYDVYDPGEAALAEPPSPMLALYRGRERVEQLPVKGFQTVPEPEAKRLRQLAALNTDTLEVGDYTIAALLPSRTDRAPVIIGRFSIVPALAK